VTAPLWARHLPRGVAPSHVDLVGGASLTATWMRRWAADPGTPVVWDAATGWTSAAQLEERSRGAAGVMAACGVGRGDRVLVAAAAGRDLVVAHVAALRLGAVVVPLNPAYTHRELDQITADATPALAVVDEDATAERLQAVSCPPGRVLGPDLAGPRRAGFEIDVAAPWDVALLAYTSGTTGSPKGVPLTHANALASAQALALAWRWESNDRLVLALPLFHMHGLGVGLHGTLTAGASCVLLPRFSPDAVLDAASRHRASMFFGVPTMYGRIAATPRAAELGRLRLCVSGSAPLPADLFERLAAVTGRPVIERYGMTETLMLLSNPYEGERRAGSVGFPLPGVKARLDADGEILVKGPNIFAGYRNRPDADEAAFDDAGWFRTGDMGSLDDDGYWRIVGRKRDLIITGGYNVYPREVEDVLRSHPGVGDVAVVGVPDPDLGECVVAVVVPEGSADAAAEASLAAHVAANLARYKQPRRIVFETALPRNAMGKVLRQELAKEVGA